MASAQEKAEACCRAAPARVTGGGPAVPVRAIAAPPAGKVVAVAAGGGERVAAGAGGAVIEEIAAVQPTTAKASSKGIPIMTRAQRCHPLDPLSAAEIAVAVATVRAAGRSPEERDSMRFVEAVLLEPGKNVVALADAYFFPPFQPSLLPRTKGSAVIPSRLPPRRARLIVYNKQSNETSIWIVELSEVHAATRGGHHRGKVISSEVIPDVQPAMDAMEYAECEATVKSYPPFIEAMKRRGVDDMDLVMVDAWCAGYYGEADAPSRRLGKPLIFCRTESDSPMENGYARPVEGIHVVVDMQNNTVIEFEDRKLVPLPPPDHLRNYTPGETRGGVDRSDVKPLIINQPEGPSFRINGYFVEWQKWNFRIGFTPKEGLVIYSVAYVDGNRGRRPIAHRLSFVEMVVPYGDPNEPHYRKNAFDAGEDGLGKNAHSLKKGCDCLGYIKYFDAHFTNFTGGVETIENCVCLHEEDHGILWKHQDWRTGLAEVRRSRRLTVSFICTVANYEYGFYWHFYQDGKIEAEVKLTGILSLGALMPGESRKYGTTIAPGLYAPVHQHFFVARMDMAIATTPLASGQSLPAYSPDDADQSLKPSGNISFAAAKEAVIGINSGLNSVGVRSELLLLALPAVLGQAIDPMAQLMETAYIGRLGALELASAGIGVSIFNIVSKIFNIPLLSIATSFVAEDISKSAIKHPSSGKLELTSVSSALILAAGIGIIEALALFLGSGLFLKLMGVSPVSPMYKPAKLFLSLRALGAPANVLMLAVQGIFRGFKDTKTPVFYIGLGNLSAVALLPLLIYGFQLGITGAAISTVASQYIITILLLRSLSKTAVLLPPRLDQLEFGGYLKSGGMLLGRTLSILLTMTIGTSMAARQGPTAMAAHQICLQVWLAVSLLADALAVSAQAMIASSYAITDYKRVQKIAMFALQVGVISGLALAVGLYASFGNIARLFTSDPEVLMVVKSCALFVCASQPINALAFIFDGLHYGVSDFDYVAQATIVVGVMSSLVLLWAPSVFGLAGVWAGLTALMGLRMAAGILRLLWKWGPWSFLHEEP